MLRRVYGVIIAVGKSRTMCKHLIRGNLIAKLQHISKQLYYVLGYGLDGCGG